MSATTTVSSCWLALLLGAAATTPSRTLQSPPSAAAPGAATYQTYCAPCHGKSGRGDGPIAPPLATAPSDLTTLSRRNRGRYPSERVYRVIDGRRPAKAHGAMPAWADAFREPPDGADQAMVRQKIAQLVDFVASLQRTPERPGDGRLALCVFSQASIAGRCTESPVLPMGTSARAVCEGILACLNDPACIKTHCGATTIRGGWTLESARRIVVQPE
jgi:mono/diheme cytochrome c family protein